MTQFSFQRLDDGNWGIKESANLDQAGRRAGETVQVTTRAGAVKQVTLGGLVTTWNGRRAAVYTIAGRAAAQPRSAFVAMTTDPESDAYATEIADDIASADAYEQHVAGLVKAAYAAAVMVEGSYEQAAYYDYTTYRMTAPAGVSPEQVHSILNRGSGELAYAYGKFGGYSTISRVSADPDDASAMLVVSCYHVGD